MKRAGLNSGFERFVAKYKEWILAYPHRAGVHEGRDPRALFEYEFFGQRSYGVATAAQTYFGKTLGELTVSRDRDPRRHPAAADRLESRVRARNARRRGALMCCGACSETRRDRRRAVPSGARRARRRQASSARRGSSKRRTSRRWFEPRWSRASATRATTAGLKVTTTIDSRLQAAANRAIRDTLMAYDERHGYRGPLARVELPGAANGGGVAGARGDRRRAAARVARRLPDAARLRERDRARAPTTSARSVFFAAHGEQSIGLDAVEWAAPFINDDATGPKPTTVAEVLKPGDVVRFRRTAEGGWRLAQIPEAQGAFVSIDPFDGAIVALNGGFDFFLNNFNRATQARRQPGSSFKPFVYSAAFENGFTPATVVLDAPPDVGYQPTLERVWRPENFGGKYFGPSRLREALYESMNAVSIRMLQSMGVPAAVSHVKRFGFDDAAVPNDLSLALGAGSVAPVSLAARLRDVRERRLQGHAVFHRSRRDGRRRGAVRDASR